MGSQDVRWTGILVIVGGFNPSQKYKSNWESSPERGENTKSFKPPPRISIFCQHHPSFCSSLTLARGSTARPGQQTDGLNHLEKAIWVKVWVLQSGPCY